MCLENNHSVISVTACHNLWFRHFRHHQNPQPQSPLWPISGDLYSGCLSAVATRYQLSPLPWHYRCNLYSSDWHWPANKAHLNNATWRVRAHSCFLCVHSLLETCTGPGSHVTVCSHFLFSPKEGGTERGKRDMGETVQMIYLYKRIYNNERETDKRTDRKRYMDSYAYQHI